MTYKNIEYNDEEPSEIESMRTENAALRAEVERLETENARLLAANRDCIDHFDACREDLAASQLEAKRLREALEASDNLLRDLPTIGGFYGLSIVENNEQALSFPTSTDALDAYVAEKVKETPLIEGGKFKTWREIALHVGAWKDHELDYIHFGSEMAVRAFVIHLLRHRDDYEAELTRQRDLAVSELETVATGFDCDNDAHKYGTYCRKCEATKALAAIKESEV